MLWVAGAACGHEFCIALDPASWCRDDSGVCQGSQEPCACSSTTAARTSLRGATTSHAPTAPTACGDDFCRSIDPTSWCREGNGVCQGSNQPCACDSKSSNVETSAVAAQSTTPLGPESTMTSSAREPAPGDVLDRYRAIAKALYVWNPGELAGKWWHWERRDIELLVSFCTVHNFQRVIVFIGSVEWDWEQHFQHKRLPHENTFAQLFHALRSAGVTPSVAFYLNDAINNLQGWAKAADVVSAVAAFNGRYPASAVAGIDGDQEPTQITEDYLRMKAHMRSKRDELGAQLSITAALKPGWLSKPYPGTTSMASAALEHLDEGMIMAYSREPQVSMGIGDKTLAQAHSVGMASEMERRVSVAVELSPRAPGSDTFWSMASGPDKAAFFQMVVDMDDHYRNGQHSVTYHDFVIHDYEGIFEALYGVKATSYHSNRVTDLYL